MALELEINTGDAAKKFDELTESANRLDAALQNIDTKGIDDLVAKTAAVKPVDDQVPASFDKTAESAKKTGEAAVDLDKLTESAEKMKSGAEGPEKMAESLNKTAESAKKVGESSESIKGVTEAFEKSSQASSGISGAFKAAQDAMLGTGQAAGGLMEGLQGLASRFGGMGVASGAAVEGIGAFGAAMGGLPGIIAGVAAAIAGINWSQISKEALKTAEDMYTLQRAVNAFSTVKGEAPEAFDLLEKTALKTGRAVEELVPAFRRFESVMISAGMAPKDAATNFGILNEATRMTGAGLRGLNSIANTFDAWVSKGTMTVGQLSRGMVQAGMSVKVVDDAFVGMGKNTILPISAMGGLLTKLQDLNAAFAKTGAGMLTLQELTRNVATEWINLSGAFGRGQMEAETRSMNFLFQTLEKFQPELRAVSEAFGFFYGSMVSIFNYIEGVVIGTFGTLIKIIMGVANVINDLTGGALSALITAIYDAAGATMSWITGALSNLYDAITRGIDNTRQWAAYIRDQLIFAFQDAAKAAMDWASSLANIAMDALLKGWQALPDWLTGPLADAWAASKAAIADWASWLVDKVGSAVKEALGYLGALGDATSRAAPTVNTPGGTGGGQQTATNLPGTAKNPYMEFTPNRIGDQLMKDYFQKYENPGHGHGHGGGGSTGAGGSTINGGGSLGINGQYFYNSRNFGPGSSSGGGIGPGPQELFGNPSDRDNELKSSGMPTSPSQIGTEFMTGGGRVAQPSAEETAMLARLQSMDEHLARANEINMQEERLQETYNRLQALPEQTSSPGLEAAAAIAAQKVMDADFAAQKGDNLTPGSTVEPVGGLTTQGGNDIARAMDELKGTMGDLRTSTLDEANQTKVASGEMMRLGGDVNRLGDDVSRTGQEMLQGAQDIGNAAGGLTNELEMVNGGMSVVSDKMSGLENVIQHEINATQSLINSNGSLAGAIASAAGSIAGAAGVIDNAMNPHQSGGGTDNGDIFGSPSGGGGGTDASGNPSGGGSDPMSGGTAMAKRGGFVDTQGDWHGDVWSSAPHFAGGGVTGGIPIIAHPNEAVVPLAGGGIPVSIPSLQGLTAATIDTTQSVKDFRQTAINIGTLAHQDALTEIEILRGIKSCCDQWLIRMSSSGGGSYGGGGGHGGAGGAGGAGGGGSHINGMNDADWAKFMEKVGRMSPEIADYWRIADQTRGQHDVGVQTWDPKYGVNLSDTSQSYKGLLNNFTGFSSGNSPNGMQGNQGSPNLALDAQYAKDNAAWRDQQNKSARQQADIQAGLGYFYNSSSYADGTPNTSMDPHANANGFFATLHTDEAIIPLPDGRSVPVTFKNAGGPNPNGGGSTLPGGVHAPVINIQNIFPTVDAYKLGHGHTHHQNLQRLGADIQRAVQNLGHTTTVDDPTRRLVPPRNNN